MSAKRHWQAGLLWLLVWTCLFGVALGWYMLLTGWRP